MERGPAVHPDDSVSESRSSHSSTSPRGSLAGLPAPRRVLWRKVPGRPDNHVDSTFLDQLSRNVDLKLYNYRELFRATASISQHISSILIYAALFIEKYEGRIEARTLVIWSTLLTMSGWLFRLAMFGSSGAFDTIRSSFLFFLTLLFVSPVLRTLTKATTSDSIWAMSVLLFIINAIFHDYSLSSHAGASKRSSNSLSTNAAIFASVVLASRLKNDQDVFALIIIAVEWFALLPVFLRDIRTISEHQQEKPGQVRSMGTSSWGHLLFRAIAWGINMTAVLALSALNWRLGLLYAIILLFISFASPAVLIYFQRYKNNLAGNWDEAKPRLSSKIIQ